MCSLVLWVKYFSPTAHNGRLLQFQKNKQSLKPPSKIYFKSIPAHFSCASIILQLSVFHSSFLKVQKLLPPSSPGIRLQKCAPLPGKHQAAGGSSRRDGAPALGLQRSALSLSCTVSCNHTAIHTASPDRLLLPTRRHWARPPLPFLYRCLLMDSRNLERRASHCRISLSSKM